MAEGLSALRILVVDDNAQMRTIVGTVLTAAGVRHVHYAPDGAAGLATVLQVQPDICFVDYEMPVMNGLDFISGVRALSSPLNIMPVIMLTGHADEPRLRSARDRGVSEFLCKPVSARTILSRLQVAILHPRKFIRTASYFGPDRRRRGQQDPGGPRRRSTDLVAVVEI